MSRTQEGRLPFGRLVPLEPGSRSARITATSPAHDHEFDQGHDHGHDSEEAQTSSLVRMPHGSVQRRTARPRTGGGDSPHRSIDRCKTTGREELVVKDSRGSVMSTAPIIRAWDIQEAKKRAEDLYGKPVIIPSHEKTRKGG